MLSMQDIDLNNRRVLIREDLNVPIQQGKITNDARLKAALPTIQQAQQQGAAVMIMSHLGRPEEGIFDDQYSLAPIAEYLSTVCDQPVRLVKNYVNDAFTCQAGDIVLLENVRFNPGEKRNDPQLAQRLAALCDVFVMDAFATAHRAQASTVGVAEYAPIACAGPLLSAELAALSKVMQAPAKPVVAIVGGAKVSTKLTVLKQLLSKVDVLIVGGGIANTFLAASGYPVGQSLYEEDLIADAQNLMVQAKQAGVSIPLPCDVQVAKRFAAEANAELCTIDAIPADGMVLDIGPQTIALFNDYLATANTILWNGPLGVFEFPAFSHGTASLAASIASSSAFSVAGGGDTLAAIDQFKVRDNISYISTGGGAFLEYIEGKPLPAVTILEQRNND